MILPEIFDPVVRAYFQNQSGGSSGGGSTAVKEKDIRFLDYDGTLLYSYSVEEFANMTELPALPTHDGLICQGWNWSLEGIKAMGRAVDIGAMYITDDGKTRLYIHLEEGRTSPVLGVCPNGTVTVDWGDGTEPDVLTGTSTRTVKWTPNHEYAAPGAYVITLTVDGSMAPSGRNDVNDFSYILRYSSAADARNKAYQNALQKVEMGSGVTSMDGSAFDGCRGLTSITIPDVVTSTERTSVFANCSHLSNIVIPDSVKTIDNRLFYGCCGLTSITIPDSVTLIGSYAFYGCYSLSSIAFPDSVTSIGGSAFHSCSSLASIAVPDSVTSIGSKAFYACSGMALYDFTNHTAVPTLAATDAFTGIAEDCEIRVPAALYDEWIAATNWATYADYIVGV